MSVSPPINPWGEQHGDTTVAGDREAGKPAERRNIEP